MNELTAERAKLLAEVAAALAARTGLESDQAERREALAYAIARLVANEGVNQAIERIRSHLDDLAQDVRRQQTYNGARSRDIAQYRADYRVYFQEAQACAKIAQALERFFETDPNAELLVTKLNGVNPDERAKRGLIPAQEGPRAPPSLRTQGPNDAVQKKIQQEIIESLPQAATASNVNLDYHSQFTQALESLKANRESFAIRFLQGKFDSACAINSDGVAVVAELKNLARSP